MNNIKLAIRQLIKNPGFTFVALATLALSLGANTAIFSFVNGVVLKPLPYSEPERIVRVSEVLPTGQSNGISTLNFLDWKKQNTCFDSISAWSTGWASLTTIENPVQVMGYHVSAHYFKVFGVKAALGRTFVDQEYQTGQNHVVVLSNTVWETQFGGKTNIVGQSIQLDDEAHTVIGVLPPNALPDGTQAGQKDTRIWRPLTFSPDSMTRDNYWLSSYARLKEGVTLEQARAQMDIIGERLSDEYPITNKDWGIRLTPLADTIISGALRQSLYLLLGAVGMVLLIACANLANLSLMRVVGREREIAIRVSLGVSRWALIKQFLTESLLVSLLGGVLGILVSQWAMMGITSMLPAGTLPSEIDVSLDGQVLLFSFLLTMLTGVVIGLFPATQAARPNLTHSLKQGGSGASTSRSHTRIRSTLVTVEVALAFVLLTGSALLIRSLSNLNQVDPGFDSSNVLTFNLPVASNTFPDSVAQNAYFQQISSRLQALPGVTDVAITSALPMKGWGWGLPFQRADQEIVARNSRPPSIFKMVSASYFSVLKMNLLQGRLLSQSDRQGSPLVAVINETMAKRHFPEVDPVGQRILVPALLTDEAGVRIGEEMSWEIVGVISNETVDSIAAQTKEFPAIYVSNEQSPGFNQGILIRSANDPTFLGEAIRQALKRINPNQMISEIQTLDAIKTSSLGDNRFRTMLLGAFASISLLLSAIGIYGVIAYTVSQRTREIGIRSALGANQKHILRLVLRHGLALTGLGLLLGIIGALGLNQLIASLLFGVNGRDPITMIIVAGILALVAVLACLIPAKRATKVDPMVALRIE